MKQQYTTTFHLNGIWVVERLVEWHANKKPILPVPWVVVVAQLVERSLSQYQSSAKLFT